MGTLFKRQERGGKSGYWYAQYIDHTGKRIKFNTKCKDKVNAQDILSQREAIAAKRKEGIIDPQIEKMREQQARPIMEHVEEMIRGMAAAGKSETHKSKTKRYIIRVIEFAKFKTVNQITPEAVTLFAEHLKGSGLSNRVVQAMLTAIKQFSKWCVTNNRLIRDPLATVKKPSPKQDRKLKRRMILPTEWQWLNHATLNGPIRGGMTGVERSLLYRVAIETGLRAKELQGLTRGKLHRGYLLVPASLTKNKKEAKQFISPLLEADLRAFASRKTAAASIFGIRDLNRLSDVIRADLAIAKQDYITAGKDAKAKMERTEDRFLATHNEENEEITFHSLRHTCGAWLALDGQPVKLIQEVMRHSTIELTIGTYGHLLPMSFESAASRLGDMLRKTGT
jgi:integrase